MTTDLSARDPMEDLSALRKRVEEAVRAGPVVRMQVHEKPTRRPVFVGFFVPPAMIETTYIDKAALADPSQSDMPVMVQAVALGYYAKPEWEMTAYGECYTWRRTPKGDALLSALETQ